MRIAVAGATGNIGARTVAVLEQAAHDVVRISRSHGIDLLSVRHHVLLSIVGIDRVDGNAHYAGKREQERLVAEGPTPWTIVPFTQFHDFAATVTSWTEHDGIATGYVSSTRRAPRCASEGDGGAVSSRPSAAPSAVRSPRGGGGGPSPGRGRRR